MFVSCESPSDTIEKPMAQGATLALDEPSVSFRAVAVWS